MEIIPTQKDFEEKVLKLLKPIEDQALEGQVTNAADQGFSLMQGAKEIYLNLIASSNTAEEMGISQPVELASTAFKQIGRIANEIDGQRKGFKSRYLETGRALDAIFNPMVKALKELQKEVKDVRDSEKIKDEQRRADLSASRMEELKRHGVNVAVLDVGLLGSYNDEIWQQFKAEQFELAELREMKRKKEEAEAVELKLQAENQARREEALNAQEAHLNRQRMALEKEANHMAQVSSVPVPQDTCQPRISFGTDGQVEVTPKPDDLLDILNAISALAQNITDTHGADDNVLSDIMDTFIEEVTHYTYNKFGNT